MTNPEVWPPDLGGIDPERIKHYYRSVIVLTLVDAYELDPIESVCRLASEGMLWTAAYQIEERQIDSLLDASTEVGMQTAMLIDLYKDDLAGYWMISGRDHLRAGAFQFPGLGELALALALAEEYMAGPKEGES